MGVKSSESAKEKEINWIPDDVLIDNFRASISRYKFIEEDFKNCLEYVMLSEEQFPVYSYRFADLLLRIGPEILKLFTIFLFNKKRGENITPKTKTNLLKLQKKIKNKHDTFHDYFKILHNNGAGRISQIELSIRDLDMTIVPFSIEKRRNNSGKEIFVVPWWEDGYNALRHRVFYEFNKAATLKNTLFSLAGYYILFEDFVCADLGGYFKSGFFRGVYM